MSNFNINQNFELGLYDGVIASSKTAKDREKIEKLRKKKLKKKEETPPTKHDDDNGKLIDTVA